MTAVYRLAMFACLGAPQLAFAHAFGERYELPVPVWLFIVGGALTVTLTFVIVAAFARAGAERYAQARWNLSERSIGRLLRARWIIAALQALGVAALALVVLAGFAGSKDPNRNVAPTLVWILWWMGFTYLTVLFGNHWPAVNPWRTLFDFASGTGNRKPFPAWLAGWLALAGLLVFGWVELIFPFRATPAVLASLVVAYSVITWAGMARYGPDAWLANADPFHRLFELFSRFAPFAVLPREGLVLRPFGAGLLWRDGRGLSMPETGFVIAMLAIVLFDGFQSSKHWVALEDFVHAIDPKLGDAGWIALHTAGLVAMWLAFAALYLLACAIAGRLGGGAPSTLDCARAFAPTLIPIAVGYQFAHTFTYLLVQGQSIVFLVSDPLGLGSDFFGTRDFVIDIAIIRTKTAWYLALGAIVVGHVISVFLAHVAAERLHDNRRSALRALVPMTVLMVIYTIVSHQTNPRPCTRADFERIFQTAL